MKTTEFIKEGEVIGTHGYGKFQVKLSNGHECTCTVSGKMSNAKINITTGDMVEVSLSTYDLSLGRIVRRINTQQKKTTTSFPKKKKKK
jgi:translation initiation factor IF-1